MMHIPNKKDGGRMMDERRTVQIHDLKWDICFVDQNDPRMQGSDGEYFGLTVYAQCLILIRMDLPDPLMKRTLRHELTHAVLFSYGLDGDSMKEEDICCFAEAYMAEIVRMADSLFEDETNPGTQKASAVSSFVS